MNHPEHARTGTSALGQTILSAPCGQALRRGRGDSDPAAPPKLVVVDLITQHDEEADEELTGDRHFGFGSSAPMEEGEVGTFEVGVRARRVGRRLTEDEAEERAALLGDVAEVICVGGGVEGWGQADVADHVLAVVEGGDGLQHDDGRQRRQGADARVGDEARGVGMGERRRGDGVVELVDLGGEPGEQLEALIPALRGMGRQVSAVAPY